MTEPQIKKQSCSVMVECDEEDLIGSAVEAVELAMDTLGTFYPDPSTTFYNFRFDTVESEDGTPQIVASVTAQPRRGA